MIHFHKGLIRGSFILLIAFGIFNFFHFLFQLVMAHMLTLSEYAVLASLFSIIYILTIFTESVQTIITKFSAEESDKGKLRNILKKSSNKSFLISLSLFIFYLIVSIPLSFLLDIDYLLLSFNGLFIFLAFLPPITRGILQGKKKFKSLGLNMILESAGKLVFGMLFVYLGFKVYGAIAGVIIGSIIALVLSLVPLKYIISSKEKKAKTFGIYDYARPTFLITSVIIIFYSLDVVIAKIFFPADMVGSYAIASILGKIIFWGTLPISKAMFPMSAENQKNKNRSDNVFTNSLIILLLVIFLILAIFYFFPEAIIKIFSGKIVPEAISILFYLGIAFGFIALTNLILLYKLSLGKTKGYYYLFTFIIIEIFLLSYFSKDLLQFSVAFITSSAVFLWGAIVLMNE